LCRKRQQCQLRCDKMAATGDPEARWREIRYMSPDLGQGQVGPSHATLPRQQYQHDSLDDHQKMGHFTLGYLPLRDNKDTMKISTEPHQTTHAPCSCHSLQTFAGKTERQLPLVGDRMFNKQLL
jgi:hypothetical protein